MLKYFNHSTGNKDIVHSYIFYVTLNSNYFRTVGRPFITLSIPNVQFSICLLLGDTVRQVGKSDNKPRVKNLFAEFLLLLKIFPSVKKSLYRKGSDNV